MLTYTTLLAIQLGLRAQDIDRMPLTEVIARCRNISISKKPISINTAKRATGRALRILRFCHLRDSCIIESLITGNLLRHSGKVKLHIGFRALGKAPAIQDVDGHAWVSLNGQFIGNYRIEDEYQETTQLDL